MNSELNGPGERRPIASRERKSSKAAALWLARRGVSANSISVAGMICGVAAGLAFASTSSWRDGGVWAWLLGAVLSQVRLLANMFDGMVAIETRTASPVGELYNEVPDRVSDAAIFIGIGYSAGGVTELGYAATCTAFLTAYIRAVGKVAGAKQEFCGPMAKQHRMFLVTVLGFYMSFSPPAWQPVWKSGLGDWGTPALVLAVIIIASVWTAIRRLSRTAAALRKLQQ